MWSCMTLFPFWHYSASCTLRRKMLGTFLFAAYRFVISFWLSCFLLIRSFHQKVYVCGEEHVFLFHMHASAECLLGLGVEDNNQWDCEVESAVSLTVSHDSLDLGWNTAADLWGFLQNNIDCLTNQVNVWCIPF